MTPLPDPAAPDALGELYAAVRKWTAHIPQNLPYVDLMFAFGHATAGDRSRAQALVESARKLMQVPIAAEWENAEQYEAAISAVVSNFVFKAFQYRIDESLAGKPHAGPLSRDLLAELDEIRATARRGGVCNPYLQAEYTINIMRVAYRTLEPHERIDPYGDWTKQKDALKTGLVELYAPREPRELADRIRRLLREASAEKIPWGASFMVLREAIPLAPRVGEDFAGEMIDTGTALLAGTPPYPRGWQPSDLARCQGELLACAVLIASYLGRRDILTKLVETFIVLVRQTQADARARFTNRVAGLCFPALKSWDCGEIEPPTCRAAIRRTPARFSLRHAQRVGITWKGGPRTRDAVAPRGWLHDTRATRSSRADSRRRTAGATAPARETTSAARLRRTRPRLCGGARGGSGGDGACADHRDVPRDGAASDHQHVDDGELLLAIPPERHRGRGVRGVRKRDRAAARRLGVRSVNGPRGSRGPVRRPLS